MKMLCHSVTEVQVAGNTMNYSSQKIAQPHAKYKAHLKIETDLVVMSFIEDFYSVSLFD